MIKEDEDEPLSREQEIQRDVNVIIFVIPLRFWIWIFERYKKGPAFGI